MTIERETSRSDEKKRQQSENEFLRPSFFGRTRGRRFGNRGGAHGPAIRSSALIAVFIARRHGVSAIPTEFRLIFHDADVDDRLNGLTFRAAIPTEKIAVTQSGSTILTKSLVHFLPPFSIAFVKRFIIGFISMTEALPFHPAVAV
jgi:hypothetical protein